jgi:hypothetical protein
MADRRGQLVDARSRGWAIVKAAEATGSPTPDGTALHIAIARQADEARRRETNLRAMIHATIQQWPGAALGGAVRRFWPR